MELSLPVIKEKISHFFGRYHYLIFFVTIVGGLIVAMFILNQTIIASDDAGSYKSNTDAVKFDTATIQKLRELNTSGDESGSQLDLSGNRISPF